MHGWMDGLMDAPIDACLLAWLLGAGCLAGWLPACFLAWVVGALVDRRRGASWPLAPSGPASKMSSQTPPTSTSSSSAA